MSRLERLYPEQKIIIPSTSSDVLVPGSSFTVSSWLEIDEAEYLASLKSQPAHQTQPVEVEIYRIIGDGRYSDFFSEAFVFWPGLKECQIVEFCSIHKEKLSPTRESNLFLFTSRNKAFVADVHLFEDGPRYYVDSYVEASEMKFNNAAGTDKRVIFFRR